MEMQGREFRFDTIRTALSKIGGADGNDLTQGHIGEPGTEAQIKFLPVLGWW